MKFGSVLALACVAAGHEQQVPLAAKQGDAEVNAFGWRERMYNALLVGGIIPDVLEPFVPNVALEIALTKKHRASMGNSIKPKKLKKPPRYIQLHPSMDAADDQTETLSPFNQNVFIKTPSYDGDDDEDLARGTDLATTCDNLVIALTDPDAPSRTNPRWSEVCHYLIYCNNNKAEELVSYKAPGPPKHTGYHRYVWVAMTPTNTTFDRLNLKPPTSRHRWGAPEWFFPSGVQNWMLQHELEPIGVNYITAKHK